ncbi:MAG: hypothetical protein LBS50_01420 [Prevotellaceae bacterium]|jgi:hypothetical protein|nr:hypothetical protein [Prevotellaceae bacterium]
MKIIALQNQTLLDLAIQHYGAAECAFDLALANDLPLDAELAAGIELTPPPSAPLANKQIADYYANRGLKPATAVDFDSFLGAFDGTFDDTFF